MGERIFASGMLSKSSGFQLIVNNDPTPKELGRLIAMLRQLRDFLEDDEFIGPHKPAPAREGETT